MIDVLKTCRHWCWLVWVTCGQWCGRPAALVCGECSMTGRQGSKRTALKASLRYILHIHSLSVSLIFLLQGLLNWFIFSDAWVFLADSHKIYSLTNYSCLFGVMLRLISSFLIYSQIYCSSSSFWVMQEATDLVLIYSLTRHNVLPVYFFIHSTFLFPAMLLVLEVVRFLLGVQKKYILKNKL